MPELPDVETFKRYFDQKGLGHKIKSIEVRAVKILEKISPDDLAKLKNVSFKSTSRHGKYLFIETSKGFFVVMHFGMTGFLFDFTKENPFNAHSRVLFTFDNGHTLAYVNTRLLGKITFADSIEAYLKEKKLGRDALSISFEDFREIFKSGSVKSCFMDQQKMAGVGNVYTDEILYQSGIHPETSASRLEEKDIKKLYRNMSSVLKKGIEAHGDPDMMPSCWLLPNRKKREHCPKCQEEIQKITVIGRPTYFCPKCQIKK